MAFRIVEANTERIWHHPDDPEFTIRFRSDPAQYAAIIAEHREILASLGESPEEKVVDEEWERFACAYLESSILSWSGLKDAETGKEVPYDPSLIRGVIPILNSFIGYIRDLSGKHLRSTKDVLEGQLGNS